MDAVYYPDLVNPFTGKKIRKENLELGHNIPIGTLVEVKLDKWLGDGACMKVHARLWVVKHHRDCDGTPMYSVSEMKDPKYFPILGFNQSGISESHMKVVRITDDVIVGKGALRWTEKEIEND